jgi:adenylate cyclase class 2
MGGPRHEIEVKLRLESAEKGRRWLRQCGFQVSRRRLFESNTVYDTPGNDLRRKGFLLRVRRVGKTSTLTFKGRAIPARHKTRPEIETLVSDPDMLSQILEKLGYRPVFRYEKYRTEYRRGEDAGVVTLDETPIGNFLELEGPPDWIDAAATMLGYRAGDYILLSYGSLYLQWCRRQGVRSGEMVFSM